MKKQTSLPKLIVKNIEQSRVTNEAEIKSAYDNIDEGSITPHTFKLRNFEQSLDEAWFTDTHEFGGQIVTSYRINKEKVPRSKSEEASKKDDEKILGEVEVKIIDKKASSVNSKNYTESDLKKVQYTNIEKQVFLKALNHLLLENNQVVLVDILEREKFELVTTKDKNNNDIKPIETHTIVLYKDPSSTAEMQKIKVIDPSNFIYSSHLKNLQDDNYFKHLQSIKPFIIETKHATLPIYKHETTNHRDCVDIAVKIALTLTNSKEIIKLDEIEKSEMFKLLSNQSMITSKQNPVFIKQTSSTETVKAFNKIEEVIKETLKNFRLIKSTKSDTIEKEHNDVLLNLSEMPN